MNNNSNGGVGPLQQQQRETLDPEERRGLQNRMQPSQRNDAEINFMLSEEQILREAQLESERPEDQPRDEVENNGPSQTDNYLASVIQKMKKTAVESQSLLRLKNEIKKEGDDANKGPTDKEVVVCVHDKTLILDVRALYFLRSTFFLRRWSIYLTEWKWFERFVILIIFLNSVFLAFYDYQDREERTQKNQVIDTAGRVFTSIFTAECVLKITSYGFIMHKTSYLRDGWNWLDFIVVIIGWIELLPSIPNLRALRTLRVLRPLRSINAIPSMRAQITALIKSLGQLINVLLFLMFLFIIFGILGVQLFSGQFYQRCRMTPTPDEFGLWPIDPEIDRLCSYPSVDGFYTCPSDRYCGAPSDFGLSLENENLTKAEYINYGITTFDDLSVGMLTIFQVITMEGWADLMYMMMDSGSTWLAAVYFIALVFLGCFFLMNIILVVIIANYSEIKEKAAKAFQEEKEQRAKQEELEIEKSKINIESEPLDKPFSRQKKHREVENNKAEIFEFKEEARDETPAVDIFQIKNDTPKNQQKQETSNGVKIADKEAEFLPKIQLNENKFRQTFYDLDQRRIKIEDKFEESIVQEATKVEKYREKSPINKESESSLIEEGKKVKKHNDAMESMKSEKNLLQNADETENQDGILTNDDLRNPKTCSWMWRTHRMFNKVCINPIFSGTIVILILINTIVLALDRHPIDDALLQQYAMINMVLTWLFFGEMVIKVIGLGPKLYVKDRFNIFDAFITLLTIAENIISLSSLDVSVSSNGAISGFRAIRLFRIFKLARQLKNFQIMLAKIAMSLKDIANFSILLFLFLFTFTLLGMEIFSSKVKFDEEGNLDLAKGSSPRENFDTFLHAFTTIFIVLIGDNWNFVMYQHVNAMGLGFSVFFIFLQVFGKYVLLNLFLAILLENFEDDGQDLSQSTNESVVKNRSFIVKMVDKIKGMFSRKNQIAAVDNADDTSKKGMSMFEQSNSLKGLSPLNSQRAQHSKKEGEEQSNSQMGSQHLSIQLKALEMKKLHKKQYSEVPQDRAGASHVLQKKLTIGNVEQRSQVNDSCEPNLAPRDKDGPSSMYNTEQQDDEAYNSNRDLLPKGSLSHSKTMRKRRNIMEDIVNPNATLKQSKAFQLKGKALYMMTPQNRVRTTVAKIVFHPYFDPFILFLIVFSTILLAVDNPLDDPKGKTNKILSIIDIVVTTLFTLEALFKILVFGLIINGPESYLRVSWNIMDFIIVIFSIISLLLEDLNIQFIKVIRMLRVLRPLRMISRNEGLKLAVLSLINSVPGIINALIIALLFFILFGIFGTNYFKGKFHYCHTDKIQETVSIGMIFSKWDCLNSGGDWLNNVINFDNLPQSMMSLFVLSSTEGWADIMFKGVDAVDVDMEPQVDYNMGWVFFFMAFMVIGSMFTLNLFVSIVVNTYYGEKEKLNSNHVLSNVQKQWLQIQVLCFNTQPVKQSRKTDHKIQMVFQRVVDHAIFEGFILVCIILNTCTLALNWYMMPKDLTEALEIINYVFTAIFTLEAIFKIIAHGFDYFKQGWNVFDFIIVLVSYITIIIAQQSSAAIGPKQTTIARAFRIGRVFRLIKRAKFLRIIFNTIIVTIPSLANVGALMILLLFIFSILGVQTFAWIQLQDKLDHHANFQSFGIAFLTLIRLQTGEGWNEVMEDTLRPRSIVFQCDNEPTYESVQANGGVVNGCGTSTAYLFFISFQLVVTIIFLNLFVAVILQGFSSSNEQEELEKFKNKIEEFKKIWVKYDPEGTEYINVTKMNDFIDDLEANTLLIPVTIKKDTHRRRMFISSLQVPTYNKFTHYYFQDVLSCIQKKYLIHSAMIEEIQSIEVADPADYTGLAKEKEAEIEHKLEMIQEIAEKQKVQMIEENFRHRNKYSKRMYDKVDRYDDKIYDSSYIVWVPVIQSYMKPHLKRILERREEQRQIQEVLDGHNLTVVMETGGEPNKKQTSHGRGINPRNHNTSSEWLPPRESIPNQRNSKRFKQTGEVGGTNTLDDSCDRDISRVVQEEMKDDE